MECLKIVEDCTGIKFEFSSTRELCILPIRLTSQKIVASSRSLIILLYTILNIRLH